MPCLQSQQPLLTTTMLLSRAGVIAWFRPLQTPNCGGCQVSGERRWLSPSSVQRPAPSGDEGAGVVASAPTPGPCFSESTVAGRPSWCASFISWLEGGKCNRLGSSQRRAALRKEGRGQSQLCRFQAEGPWPCDLTSQALFLHIK